jgi:hypothetical protein
MAISGETPALPLIIFDKVGRETPKTIAALVTLNPSASIQSCFKMLPGCAGFFIIDTSSSVIINKINGFSAVLSECEYDPVSARNLHAPETLHIFFNEWRL